MADDVQKLAHARVFRAYGQKANRELALEPFLVAFHVFDNFAAVVEGGVHASHSRMSTERNRRGLLRLKVCRKASGVHAHALQAQRERTYRHPTKCRVGYSPTAVPLAILKPASLFQML